LTGRIKGFAGLGMDGQAPRMKGDQATTIGELKARVAAFAQERDWEQFHTPKNLSMALAAEAAELMEVFLWAEDGGAGEMAKSKRRAEVSDELADVVIYALEFSQITGIDLTAAIHAKMRRNAEKYPVEKARGRSVKYTEL
jgi:dCTP diphosphatase